MKNIILICIFACCSLQLFAQMRVSGTVRDEAGLEVIGANVVQKGTVIGIVTDIAGKFSIILNNNAELVLQISMIGYEKSEIDVRNKTSVDVVLKNLSVGLGEVLVVGYGTQKKASVTGSIANVGSRELNASPVPSVTNALTGRVSGLVTRQESGRPGGDAATLFIRGRGTFNNSAPLVLVDGVERSFSQIDPDDIESVSILKDASATAVYGVRGANGVVLVTTKRGNTGKSKILFSSEYGITQYNRITRVLNAETTSRFQREGTINAGLDPSVISNTSNFKVSEYDNYLYRTQLSPFTHPDNSFVDIFTKPGAQQKYNLNISGGNNAVKYYVSVGYFTQDGMFQTDVNKIKEHPTLQRLIEFSPEAEKAFVVHDYNQEYLFNRLNTRSNIDISITDDLKLGVDMAYRFMRQNRPGTYDGWDNAAENMRLFGMFYRNAPQAFPIVNINGTFGGAIGVWRQNPLVTVNETGYRTDYDNQMETTLSLNYNLHKVLKGLSIDGKYSYDIAWSNWRGMQWRPSIFSYDPVTDYYTLGLAAVLPYTGSGRTSATYNKYMELALRYKQTFASKHNVSAVVLGTYSSVSLPSGEYSYVPQIYQALIGRANYDYDNRYLFEVNMGYNGSNRFAEGHRYQLFPAASAGWILTNEHFIPKMAVLNYAKIRGSYGQVGSDKLGSFSYYYKSTYDNGSSYSFGATQNPIVTGLIEGSLANELITWETSTKYNIGFDTRWFDSKLTLNGDIFKEHRTDILTTPNRFLVTSGITSTAPVNLGIVDNHGYEIELGWDDLIGNDFSYFVKAIYGNSKNTVVEMSEANKPYDYMYSTGQSIGQWIGYKFDGFFQSSDEIASSPQQFGLSNLAPGDIKYKDLNGDGIVNQDDQCPIGYGPLSEITYSLRMGIDYKGFDISIMFQGATHSSIYLVGDLGWDNSWGNYYDNHINHWTPETASTATYPRFLQKSDAKNQNYYLSDFWLIDGDYLRLKNLQVGYSLPKLFLKRISLQEVRFYANAYNLLTWDKVKKVDPETNPESNNGYFYPQQRISNFGMSVTF
ncbi:MAG: TonB-dependent receptor [Bacteroidia bacterium]|nr:TonB-dependent receptor [Bacteroidia bacterium]